MKRSRKILSHIYRHFQRHFYGHFHSHRVKSHFRTHERGPFKSCNVNNFIRLSFAWPGVYRLIVVYCSEKLEHRLLEMGFIPGENLTVVENTGPKGGVTVKIKGAKVALSSEVAYKILLERKK